MPAKQPLSIPFFGKGLITNRFALFNALQSVGVSVVKFQDALIDGLNVEVSDIYSLQRRPGFTKYCTQQLQAGEIPKAFYSVRNLEGAVTPLVDTNFALYAMSPTALTSILTKNTSNQSFIQQVGNITYITNGVDVIKWNGTTTTPWGIAAPTIAPTIANTLTHPGSWISGFNYAAGSAILDVNGNIEYCTTAGISGTTFPVWNPTLGAKTTDGTVVWEQVGPPQLYWVASTPYTAPTVITDTNSNLQLVTAAGTSNTSAPSWNTTLGGTTTDSGVTWTNIGPGLVQAYVGWSYVHAFRTVSGNLSTASPISTQTGPILSSTSLSPVTITADSISSNVATFTCANSFSVGQSVTLNGFPTSTFLNGQTVVVLASGLSSSQFKANFTHADTSMSEVGQGYPVIATISGQGSANPECNSTATITAVSVTSDIVTITCVNNFVPGLSIQMSGLTNATFLNGQTLTVDSTNAVGTAEATQFTAVFSHVDYPTTSDIGAATFLAVEIYRIDDGGGVYYFDGAAVNPANTPISSFDSTLLLAGAGADNGVPGVNAWTNPNNVTSASSYATSAFNPPSSGLGTFNVVQVATGLGHYGYNVSRDTYSNGPTNISASLGTAVTSGNCLLCVVMVDNSTETISAIGDNHSNTYTLINSENGLFVYMVYAPTAATTTVTVTVTPDIEEVVTIVFAELNGLQTGTNLDVTAKATGASKPFNSGSVTTTNDPDVIITAAYQEVVGGNVQPTGYTILGGRSFSGSDGGEYQLQVAYAGVTSLTTYSPDWSNSSSQGTAGITVALKSTSTAGTNGLNATTFPISVPSGVTAQGIKVEIDAKYNGGSGLGTVYAQLLKNGNPFGTVKTITPTSTVATYTLGGSSDLWGGAWVSTDFTASTMWGVQISATQVPQSGGPYTFSIKNVNAEVYGESGITTWTFNDISPDDQLDNEEVAPLSHQNDPPPGTTGSVITSPGTILAFWNGRLWIAVGNTVYFDGGPDVLNGINRECWPPANSFTFPGPITGLIPSSGGLVVTTSKEWWAVLGGPQTATFYPERIFGNFGVLSPNDIAQDGDNIYVYTSQKQLFQVQGGNQNEIGFSISGLLANGQSTSFCTASAWSPSSSYLAMHRNGDDIGVLLSNGLDSIVRYGTRFGNWSPIYQPNLNNSAPVAGTIGSVETSSGVFSLLLGSTTAGDYIYTRNLTTFTDNGHAYHANAVVGNIVVAEMGEPLVPMYFISGLFSNLGTVPTVSFMSNEILATGTGTAKFTALPFAQSEPAYLAASQSLLGKRWPTSMNQSGTPLMVKHVQVNFDFGTDTVKNELYEFSLRFDREQMV